MGSAARSPTVMSEVAMNIRKILVAMDSTEPAVIALETAFTVAKAFSAHVGAIHVPAPISMDIPSVGEGMSEEALTATFREVESRRSDHLRRTRGLFDESCRRRKVAVVSENAPAEPPAASWQSIAGQEEGIIAHHGRLSDLIVMPRPSADARPAAEGALHAALFDTGRPVLLPGAGATMALPETIAIAWNGSVEAVNALTGAHPFLERARRILILTAEGVHTRAEMASELKAYLGLHGLKSEVRVFPRSSERPVPAALLHECAEERVDMLVMGAYTHSRWRELILGGVTRHVIHHASIPLVMAR